MMQMAHNLGEKIEHVKIGNTGVNFAPISQVRKYG